MAGAPPVPAAPETPDIPWPTMPPAQQGGGTGQSEGYFNVGYPGTDGPVGQRTGAPQVQGPAPFDWQGLQDWDARTSGYFDQAARTLQGFNPANSQFAQALYSLFSGGQGFSPDLMARLRTEASEREAGSRENALLRSRARSRATGFGDSAAANYAEDQIRTQSASNLQRNMNELDRINELMGLRRQLGTGGLLASLYGQQAGVTGQLANLYANRQAPMYPGGTAPGGGGGHSGMFPPGQGWWNQSGRYVPGARPADPFVQGNQGNAGPEGGWTPQNPWSPW